VEKKKTHKISPLILALGDKKTRNFAITAVVAKKLSEKYVYNADYFGDFIKFNFGNRKNCKKVYAHVNPADPPMSERDRFIMLYRKLKNYNTDEIYSKLGLEQTSTNKNAPIETKWAFEYRKKYKSLLYKKNNVISNERILTPLKSLKDKKRYADMF
jgi:hypothetical protein